MSKEPVFWPSALSDAVTQANLHIGRLIALLPNTRKARLAARLAKSAGGILTLAESHSQEFWNKRLTDAVKSQFPLKDLAGRMECNLSDMRLHEERNHAIAELLDSYLRDHADGEKGGSYCLETAEAIGRLLFDHREQLYQTVLEATGVWRSLRGPETLIGNRSHVGGVQ